MPHYEVAYSTVRITQMIKSLSSLLRIQPARERMPKRYYPVM